MPVLGRGWVGVPPAFAGGELMIKWWERLAFVVWGIWREWRDE
jgi:hypothetical protein